MTCITRIRAIAWTCAAALALGACGGGVRMEPDLTGVLMAEGPIGGVAYETTSQQGVTGADGSFRYRPGEDITFTIGAFRLGDVVVARPVMTPLDLVPGSAIPTTVREVRSFRAEHERPAPAYESFNRRPRALGSLRVPRPVSYRHAATMRMINLLRLLRGIDRDKDASNGVTVHPQAAGAFSARTPDLSLPFGFFRDALRHALFAAFRAGAVPSATQDANWGLALDAFAVAQGVVPQVYMSREVRHDEDANGSIDAIETREFDARGLRVSESFEFGGNPRSVADHTFDSWGNPLSTRNDAFQVLRRYDPHGSLLRLDFADANNRPIRSVDFTYDDDGRCVREAVDEDADGASDNTLTRTFDADGVLRRVEITGRPTTVPQTITLHYDPQGRLSRIADDVDQDGVDDDFVTLEYDEQGRVTTQRWQVIEGEVRTYVYDASGRITRRTVDRGANGIIDRTTTFTFHPNGLFASITETNDTTSSAQEFEYDQYANMIFNRSAANGVTISTLRTQVDSRGHPTGSEADWNADGVVDVAIRFFNDANGIVTRIDSDGDNDGVVESQEFRVPQRVSFASFARDGDGEYEMLTIRGF